MFNFILRSIVVNSFPVSGLSGMFITMLASGGNFGNLTFAHLWLTGILGWKTCAIIGVCLQLIIIIRFPVIYREVDDGSIEIDSDLIEEESMVGEIKHQTIET